MLNRAAASLCDGLIMTPKMLRLRSSSQMREINIHGAAGGGLAQAERLREGYRCSMPSGAQSPGIRGCTIGERHD